MRFSPSLRITIGLVSLTVSLLLLSKAIGLAPDREKAVLESRKELSQTLAIQFSAAVKSGDFTMVRTMLGSLVKRDNDVQSAAIRKDDGELIAVAGNHLEHWQTPDNGLSTPTHVQIPIFRDEKKWAVVEVSFTPIWQDNIKVGLKNSYLGLILFIGVGGFACYFLLIKWSLRELDPSEVIPERVRAAFDVLKEGVLILDNKEQIVLANSSFADFIGKDPKDLVGFKGSEIGWQGLNPTNKLERLPWLQLLKNGTCRQGVRLLLETPDQKPTTFIVNTAPVLDAKNNPRGALVTFDDVTELEARNVQLSQTVSKLQDTTTEVQTKNKELEFLANHDPLTTLLNRRSLNSRFETVFREKQQSSDELSCIMCDIDHFKSVNDRYGHATGDKVIKMVATILKKHFRQDDLIGRYGGEEFCIVLPDITLKKAADIADRVRLAIRDDSSSGVPVTMSFGVSSLIFNSNDPDELVNQADKALYIAKESGRNRVVCWGDDDIEELVPAEEVSNTPEPRDETVANEQLIPLQPIDTVSEEDGKEEIRKLTIRLQEMEKVAKMRAKELEHFEAYDQLTGLPTRPLFYDRVTLALARGRRYENIVAVLALSMESTQRISETLGHDEGDRLILLIAKRIIGILRETDAVAQLPSVASTPTVSRINHEEFGILLTDLESVDVIAWIVKRLLNSFDEPFHLGDSEFYASANIGISIYPNDGESAQDLEQNANIARSHAKNHIGPNSYYYYSHSINDISRKHLELESQLRKAVVNNEFLLHYQPKVDTLSGLVCGLEALVRWQKPGSGLVLPGEFIPVAEHAGLISTIGEWVLKNACRQLRSWLDMGYENCNIAVNFSSKQFRNPKLSDDVETILTGFGIEPHHLVIEVTESAMMENMEASLKILQELRDLGVSVALDDFGSGYSSLMYLKNIPVSHVKIDRSFIADIETNKKDALLVKSIIDMAHGLELKVTAEGVESAGQVEYLRACGCDELQGYLLSKPISADTASSLLQQEAPILPDRHPGHPDPYTPA